MASGFTTQQEAFDYLDSMLHGKFSTLKSRQRTLNRAVIYVVSDIDLRGTKRKETLSPNLFRDVYDYTSPSTMKERAVIDIKRQVNRPLSEKFVLVDEEKFDREKGQGRNIFTFSDDELARNLRIEGGESDNVSLHTCDSLTANGTWAASADASNLTIDTENFISAGGSLNFDTAEGAATAVIELTGATQVDLTDHDEKSSIFVWVFIPDAVDASADAVTNFILRWGNDSSNYWSRTVTTNNEGNAFYDGWNLLRFDWNGATETGTVAPATIDYIRLTITKPTTFAADTDWRVDSIVSRVGDIYDVVFYSSNGWQTSANSYIPESTTTTDTLNVEVEELNLILTKAAQFGSIELRDYVDAKEYEIQYERGKSRYLSIYPSERIKLKNTYYSIRRTRF